MRLYSLAGTRVHVEDTHRELHGTDLHVQMAVALVVQPLHDEEEHDRDRVAIQSAGVQRLHSFAKGRFEFAVEHLDVANAHQDRVQRLHLGTVDPREIEDRDHQGVKRFHLHEIAHACVSMAVPSGRSTQAPSNPSSLSSFALQRVASGGPSGGRSA